MSDKHKISQLKFDANEALIKRFRCTLKQTSLDDSQKVDGKRIKLYLTESTLDSANFDSFKNKFCRRFSPALQNIRSVDALISSNQGCCLVEFKNGYFDISELHSKIFDSYVMYCEVMNVTASQTRENLDFVLVYNREKFRTEKVKNNGSNNTVPFSPSYEKMKNHLGNQAKRTITDLGLEKYRTFCFRNVYSFDKEEFNEFLERKYQN